MERQISKWIKFAKKLWPNFKLWKVTLLIWEKNPSSSNQNYFNCFTWCFFFNHLRTGIAARICRAQNIHCSRKILPHQIHYHAILITNYVLNLIKMASIRFNLSIKIALVQKVLYIWRFSPCFSKILLPGQKFQQKGTAAAKAILTVLVCNCVFNNV